jgi:hypothetical protein
LVESVLPYSTAIASGRCSQNYVKNFPGKQGYTNIFKQLDAQGLQIGVNSRDGKHHIFQTAHYEAVYGASPARA